MSDSIVINVIPDPSTNITINDTGENVYLNPLTLNQGIINHSVTHQSGGSDELLHNLLGGLNGGQSGQYYHLTQNQYNNNVYRYDYPVYQTGSQSITGVKSFIDLINVSGVKFQVLPTAPPYQEGLMFYDDQNKTVSFYVENSDVTLNLGQEMWVRGYNDSTGLINNGSVVYISGAQGSSPINYRPKIWKAIANSERYSAETIGIATHDISVGENGYITTFGIVNGLNTSSFDPGDVLYLSPTISGAFTNAKPTAPNHAVKVGYVLSAHNNQGKILVSVNNGYEIDELHNVKINNPQNNQILKFNSESGIWENQYVNTGDISGLSIFVSNSQSGLLNKTESDALYVGLSGNQEIYGIKNFHYRPTVNGTGVLLSGEIPDTGYLTDYLNKNETGDFYPKSNPSGFITGVDFSSYATQAYVSGASGYLQTEINTLNNHTGDYVLDSETGQFYSTNNPSGFITGVDLSNVLSLSGGTLTGALALSSNTAELSIVDTTDLSEYPPARNLISVNSFAGELFTLNNYGIAKFSTIGDLGHNWYLLGNIDGIDAHFNQMHITAAFVSTIYSDDSDFITIDTNVLVNGTVDVNLINSPSVVSKRVYLDVDVYGDGRIAWDINADRLEVGELFNYNNYVFCSNGTGKVGQILINRSSNTLAILNDDDIPTYYIEPNQAIILTNVSIGGNEFQPIVLSNIGPITASYDEITYGTETVNRSYSPSLIKFAIDTHAPNAIASAGYLKEGGISSNRTLLNLGGVDLINSGTFFEGAGMTLDIRFPTILAGSANAATDIITLNNHGLTQNLLIVFSNVGTSGLTLGIPYFVKYVDASNFQVAATSGGAAVNITGDSNVSFTVGNNKPQVALAADSTAANIDFRIQPKGNGAFYLGPLANNSSTGGGVRGSNSVDLQTYRQFYQQIASGAYSFAAGSSNAASGSGSVAIGSGNSSSSSGSISLGGNNTSSGTNSVAIGESNTSSGRSSIALGSSNTASNGSALALGNKATADKIAMIALAAGGFGGTAGTAQNVIFPMGVKTTSNTPTELRRAAQNSTEGSSDLNNASAHYLTIASGKVFAFTATICGIKSDGSAVAMYVRKGCIKNVGGTTSLVGSIETLGTDIEDNAATNVSITADNTNDRLAISVTGITAETWRWCAEVRGVEIAYGT